MLYNSGKMHIHFPVANLAFKKMPRLERKNDSWIYEFDLERFYGVVNINIIGTSKIFPEYHNCINREMKWSTVAIMSMETT